MSNYAETLKEKLEAHRDTDLLDIDTDIDELIDLADKAVDEFEEANDIEDLTDKVEDLESEIDEMKPTVVDASEWGLLGVLIVEEINAIMKNPKTNQNKFLEMLQFYHKRRM